MWWNGIFIKVILVTVLQIVWPWCWVILEEEAIFYFYFYFFRSRGQPIAFCVGILLLACRWPPSCGIFKCLSSVSMWREDLTPLTSYNLNYFLSDPSPNSVTLEGRASTYELWEDANIWFVTDYYSWSVKRWGAREVSSSHGAGGEGWQRC